jgi:hypothetical protein
LGLFSPGSSCFRGTVYIRLTKQTHTHACQINLSGIKGLQGEESHLKPPQARVLES